MEKKGVYLKTELIFFFQNDFKQCSFLQLRNFLTKHKEWDMVLSTRHMGRNMH